MAGVNINACVTFIASGCKPSDSPTIRRHTITSVLGIYINHEAQRCCHDAVTTPSSLIRPRLVKRPRKRPGPGHNTPARACPTAGSRRTLHVHTCAVLHSLHIARSCLAVAERTSSCCPTDTFLATGAEEVRMHTPSRVCERVGGVHTANGVTSEGAISHVILGYARWCDRMIFVCLSVVWMGTFRAF